MPARPRNALLEQLDDLNDPTPRDFDPEDEQPADSEGSDAGSDAGSDEAAAGRDHYVGMGKSKLRKPVQVSLGPRYEGSRVSRDAVGDDSEDDDDDPFAKRFDEENGETDVSVEDKEESDAEEDGVEVEDDLDDSVDELNGDGLDEEADSDASSDEDVATETPATGASTDILQALAQDRQRASKMQAQHGAKADAEKGRAVRKQRATFDALLNSRIKLQKALIGANTLAGLAQDTLPQDEEDLTSAYHAAETAALNLWTSLSSLRSSLTSARAGSKRDHETAFPTTASVSSLWTHLQGQNASSRTYEDDVLGKWYRKTHETELLTASSGRGRNSLTGLSSGTPAASVQNILSDALADNARLLRRARTPRSCAPYQLARLGERKPRKPAATRDVDEEDGDDAGGQSVDDGDKTVYDDADFYSVLLTTLLEQRSSVATAAAGGASAGTAVDLAHLNGYQIRREAKTRRAGVDTKASKGRKLRYTVHEKLLDYMAPEDRGTWGERQIDELFGSLLGRRMVLDEEERGQDGDGVDGDVELGLEGRLLFGH